MRGTPPPSSRATNPTPHLPPPSPTAISPLPPLPRLPRSHHPVQTPTRAPPLVATPILRARARVRAMMNHKPRAGGPNSVVNGTSNRPAGNGSVRTMRVRRFGRSVPQRRTARTTTAEEGRQRQSMDWDRTRGTDPRGRALRIVTAVRTAMLPPNEQPRALRSRTRRSVKDQETETNSYGGSLSRVWNVNGEGWIMGWVWERVWVWAPRGRRAGGREPLAGGAL